MSTDIKWFLVCFAIAVTITVLLLRFAKTENASSYQLQQDFEWDHAGYSGINWH